MCGIKEKDMPQHLIFLILFPVYFIIAICYGIKLYRTEYKNVEDGVGEAIAAGALWFIVIPVRAFFDIKDELGKESFS